MDLFSANTFSGALDVRAALSKGERSWAEDGFGKTRFSGGNDSYALRTTLASADLVWRPRFSWNSYALVDIAVQPGQHQAVEVSEAFLAYKTKPTDTWGASAKLGYYWPYISLEHDGPTWRVTNTITPSAINSWVGEEVKVLGGEATLSRKIAGQQVLATAGMFGNDDTSGTLLTYRGWAMHDLRSTLQGRFPLSPLSGFMITRQDQWTESSIEIDTRAGYYGRLEWQPSQSSSLHAFYYDNVGNRTAVEKHQWAWDTRFTEVGGKVWLTPETKLTAQAMTGNTIMGYPRITVAAPLGERWANVDFNSAYGMITHKVGGAGDTASLRADWFEVKDKSMRAVDNNNERGWGVTAAYLHRIAPNVTLVGEALHVTSNRPSRAYGGWPAKVNDTTFQASLRIDL
jgi:hypothetical protein